MELSRGGFEPPTRGVSSLCSTELSYRDINWGWISAMTQPHLYSAQRCVKLEEIMSLIGRVTNQLGWARRRMVYRHDWDAWGIFLALLLLVGEGSAGGLAAASIFLADFDVGNVAALVGAATIVLYVPLAIGTGKLPFAPLTEYERRRREMQRMLGVRIPRTWDTKDWGGRGTELLTGSHVHLKDDSDEAIRMAVGRAYCLGDLALQRLCGTLKPHWTAYQRVRQVCNRYPKLRLIAETPLPTELMSFARDERDYRYYAGDYFVMTFPPGLLGLPERGILRSDEA